MKKIFKLVLILVIIGSIGIGLIYWINHQRGRVKMIGPNNDKLELSKIVNIIDEGNEIIMKKNIGSPNCILPILGMTDPENPWIGIWMATISTGSWFKFSDPSENSIAVRQMQDWPRDENGKILIDVEMSEEQKVKYAPNYIHTNTNYKVLRIGKSIGLKELRIARQYDVKRKTLIYTVYITTPVTGGSYKFNISAVVLH